MGDLDVILVGAGFSSYAIVERYIICAFHVTPVNILISRSLRKRGFKCKIFEKGSSSGGTWHWNRYPGAGSDSTSEVYRYSWDKEDLRTYHWSNRYLSQPEIQGYLKHIVERHNLQQYIQLNTELLSAHLEDSTWTVRFNDGETIRARYLATALGGLSKTNIPNIPGIKTFSGDIYHSM